MTRPFFCSGLVVHLLQLQPTHSSSTPTTTTPAPSAPPWLQQHPCDYTLDTAENKAGMIRGGSYFTATAATGGNVAACAALCCASTGCRSFSLDVGWGMQWLGCVAGKPCCALNQGLGPFEPYNGTMHVTTGVVHAPPSTGKPPGVNRSFDCAVRQLAYEYARSLRPDKGNFSAVHDGAKPVL